MNARTMRKEAGAYYTPGAVVATLLDWAVHSEDDRFLDPSCGDGRFIASHRHVIGIEQDPAAASIAIQRAPWALVHEGDFFSWAAETSERFDAVGGNPPFIRYQTFKGSVRAKALSFCARLGVEFTALTSSWAPFIVGSASLLLPGGRLAFVVPAEIGHAPYAAPLLKYLAAHFGVVHVVAFRDKFFPELSEDCWLLYAENFGASSNEIRFTVQNSFRYMPTPPRHYEAISLNCWDMTWNRRLRPFILPPAARDLYADVLTRKDIQRLHHLARVGIGYVSGDNSFFHLRPSEAEYWNIPGKFLRPAVRKSEVLPPRRVTQSTVNRWSQNDDEMLLLNIPRDATDLPRSIKRYLETDEASAAREAYKCRNRSPWYSVPDVQTPDFFLSYMSGRQSMLVHNDARCTCTNSVHAVRVHSPNAASQLDATWDTDFVRLSCEIEGHPLGGGMLKLEPGEAAQIVLPSARELAHLPSEIIRGAIDVMREWRHYAC